LDLGRENLDRFRWSAIVRRRKQTTCSTKKRSLDLIVGYASYCTSIRLEALTHQLDTLVTAQAPKLAARYAGPYTLIDSRIRRCLTLRYEESTPRHASSRTKKKMEDDPPQGPLRP
jgi:hypothetical protein